MRLVDYVQLGTFGLAFVLFLVGSFTRPWLRFDPVALGLAVWALSHLLNNWTR